MKLRYLIDLLLSPELKALTQVDKYAGMVRTIYQRVDNGTENSPIKRYPVACDVQNPDCANTGVYDELIPDDKYNSLVYWEEVSPMKNNGYSSSQKDFYNKTFTGTARLVFWGNLAALGLEDCNGLFYALPDIEKILTKKGRISSGEYEGFNYWIQPQSMVKQDINVVFGKYDYSKDVRYYLYPYDFFAVDVTFQLNQCLKKGGAFPVLPSIDCPNNIGPTACERLLPLITPELKCSCVIPSLDFSEGNDTDWDCFDANQKADITLRACTSSLPTNIYSTQLNGTNQVINTKQGLASYDLERTDSFTFIAWIKPTGAFQEGDIINKFAAPMGYYLRAKSNGKIRLALAENSASNTSVLDVESSGAMTLGVWNKVAVSYTGGSVPSSVSLYINDVLQTNVVNVNTLSGSINNASEMLKFGGNTAQGRYFKGLVNVIRIWDFAMSLAEIQAETVSGAPAIPSTFPLNSIVDFYGGDESLYCQIARAYPDGQKTNSELDSYYSQMNGVPSDLILDAP